MGILEEEGSRTHLELDLYVGDEKQLPTNEAYLETREHIPAVHGGVRLALDPCPHSFCGRLGLISAVPLFPWSEAFLVWRRTAGAV